MGYRKTKDDYVMEYQETRQSDILLEKYEDFLNRYYYMLVCGIVDFSHYDVREFLSYYIDEDPLREDLLANQNPSSKVRDKISKMLGAIRSHMKIHSDEDIQVELQIIFLDIASTYRRMGKSFDAYLHKSFGGRLKSRLNQIINDVLSKSDVIYNKFWQYEYTPLKEENENATYEMYDDLQLNDPRWIHGNLSTGVFESLKNHERFILAKYYFEGRKDKEIARLLPYNVKSISRIRIRIKKKFFEMYYKGELICLRM